MQNRFGLSVIVLVGAVVLPGSYQSAWARSGRDSIIARQRIRAQLVAAMADGALSKSERRSILITAQSSLAPAEFAGLVDSLDRASAVKRTRAATASVSKPTKAGLASTGTSYVSAKPSPKYASKHQSDSQSSKPESPSENDSSSEPGESPFKREGFADEDDLDCGLSFDEESCDGGCNGECRSCSIACNPHLGWRHIRFSTTIDAFKGPMDLDNQNGNFGINFAFNGGFPAIERMGIGIQVGTSAVLSDFHGTQFTGSTIRSQNFTTAGAFQSVTMSNGNDLKWGFAFDWLYDKYYTTFQMSQWRVKLGYELNPCHEIGIWACIPDAGDKALLSPGNINQFRPVAQYNCYWRRCWPNAASTTLYLGAVEEPGQVTLGSRVRMPLTGRASIIANFNYVLPSASGIGGQDEEMWNVAMGIEIIPGWGGNRCPDYRFAPLLPLADNGIFAIRRL